MIRVAIADDHEITRLALRGLMAQSTDCVVVGEASDGREACQLVRDTPLEVLILDLSMPVRGGVETLAAICRMAANVRILIFTGYAESSYAFNLLRTGASGFLSKACDAAEILIAVRALAGGKRYVSDAVLASHEWPDEMAPLDPHQQLTARQFQVFLQLARGKRLGEIGKTMNLSTKTITAYRTAVLKTMGLTTNAQLTNYALKSGLLD